MKKLQTSRTTRFRIELVAAKAIQKVFRGFSVRSRYYSIYFYYLTLYLYHLKLFYPRIFEIIKKCKIHRRIRSMIVSGLQESGNDFIVRLGDHRQQYSEIRYASAAIIQRSFRCCLSRFCVTYITNWLSLFLFSPFLLSLE